MTWEPLTRQELDRMIADGLALYDEAVRAEWERVKIEPVKWKCSPWGDLGGGFWAVAILGSRVLWYNDIEHGFNYSNFSERGVIDEYWCNQDEFVEILERFAHNDSEDAWSRLAPSDVPATISGPGTVVYRQTTYWDIQPREGPLCRIHFRDKEEFGFREAPYGRVAVHAMHPLLASYTEQIRALYIAGEPADRGGVASNLDEAIRFATSDWRRLEDFRADGLAADALLSGGHGLLLTAPTSICDAVFPVLERAGLRPSAVGGHSRAKGQQALVLGRNFVDAREFGFELRSGS